MNKEETLEEVAERKFENIGDRLIFEDGAKWQKERMYSEEEVMDILKTFRHHSEIGNDIENIELWFEQFKKK
jgi:hypothetical protein